MDQVININLQKNEAPPQEVYIIQLDANAQIEAQAIPLHLLENGNLRLHTDEDLNGGILLPILQQNSIQQMPMLIIDPVQEPVKLPNQCLNIQADNSTAKNNEVLVIPSSSVTFKSSVFINDTQNCSKPEQNVEKFKMISDIKLEEKRKFQYVNESVDMALPKEDDIQLKKEPPQADSPQAGDNLNYGVKIHRISPSRQKIKNYVHISDVRVPLRAVAVLPTVLQIREKWISPRRTLSARVRFGPVQGIRTTITRTEAKILAANASKPVFLLFRDEDHVTHIDVSDKDKCNWIGLLPLGEGATDTSPSTANVWIYEESNELYALTALPIGPRTPLKLGYSKKYADDHGIQQASPVFDLETVTSIQWWCNECNRALPSATLFQRHSEVYHKETTKSCRPTYRCKYCKRAFGRIFSMRRHMQLHCLKKPQKSEKIQEPEPNPEPDNNSDLEDNRIPSDESFQNFTNSLDFSTNLFDTDRMAGLDLASNSRADSEISYGIGFRDDNALSNDLGFTKLTNAPENVDSKTSQEKQNPMLENCAYCKQVVVKEKKSKHLRQCPLRLICECGRVFRHKLSLIQHIAKSHPTEKLVKSVKEPPTGAGTGEHPEPDIQKDNDFRCQECQLRFKRRGMLVNHLWRIHKLISTIPVEKKVLHYPCVACPKIYKSSTKRDNHVRAHHPGVGKVRVHSIDGGVKSCQAASCTECPRQYGTRAKLLQHIRAHHPHLVKSNKSQQSKKSKTKTKTNPPKTDAVKETVETIEIPRSQLKFNFC